MQVSREDSMAEFGGQSMQSIVERGCFDVGKRFLERLTLRNIWFHCICIDGRDKEQCHKEQLEKVDTKHCGDWRSSDPQIRRLG
jgi:hypothetical protein